MNDQIVSNTAVSKAPESAHPPPFSSRTFPPQTYPDLPANAVSATLASQSTGIRSVSAEAAFANKPAAKRAHRETRSATAPSHAPRARCLHPLSCHNPDDLTVHLVVALFVCCGWTDVACSVSDCGGHHPTKPQSLGQGFRCSITQRRPDPSRAVKRFIQSDMRLLRCMICCFVIGLPAIV